MRNLRRRRGGVAARGEGAATGDAGDWRCASGEGRLAAVRASESHRTTPGDSSMTKTHRVGPGDSYDVGFKAQTVRAALIARFD